MKQLAAGHGFQYLLRSVAKGDHEQHRGNLNDYYAAEGTPPGRWYGTGLQSLDKPLAHGALVDQTQMAHLFGEGHSPTTGDKLGRDYAVYKPDANGKRRQAVAGYDLTFNPAKSFSVAWALADDTTQAKLRSIHHQVMESVIQDFERSVAFTRTGTNGANHATVTGVMAAAFDHWDSRAHDPHLHTHLVISNKVMSADGKWRTLDGAVVRAAMVTLSESYNSRLADAVTTQMGWSWSLRDRGPDRNNQWEIDGISDELVAEFSSRNRDIEARTEELVAAFTRSHGHGPDNATIIKLRDQATRETRPDKEIIPLGRLRKHWADRAEKLTGQPATKIIDRLAKVAGTHEQFEPDHLDRLTAQVLATVSNTKASFTHWNLRAEAERATRKYRFATQPERDRVISTITEAALGRAVLLTPEALTEAPGHSFRPHRGAKYTTQRTLDAEARLLTASTLTTAPAVHVDRAHAIARSTKSKGGHFLSTNQSAAVVSVTTSGRALDLLVGPAGAGKSTAMSAVRAVWESQHGQGTVIGLAPSQRAAKILSDEINTPTANTAKWLYETTGEGGRRRAQRVASARRAIERCGSAEARTTLQRRHAKLFAEDRKWSIRSGQLIIIDEASLAGTHTLDELRAQVQNAGAKLLLVGDHHQLQAVETGGAFGMLVRSRPDTPELTEVRRFDSPWEAEASLKIRKGDHTITGTYAAHGRLHGGTQPEMLDAAYSAWLTDTNAGKNSLLIAPDNDTVRELNERARTHRIENGDVSDGKSVALRDGTRASRGDIVVSRLNDNTTTDAAGEAVSNRDQWVVEKVHASGALTLRRVDPEAPASSAGARVRVDKDYAANDMELGYATTAHGAQGLTVDTAHGVATRNSTRELLYVVATRAKEENHLYLVVGDDTPYSVEAAITTPEEVFNHILTAEGAERSATEQARDEQAKWMGFDQVRDEYLTLSHSTDQPRWEDLINTSPLTDDQKQTVLASEAWPSLANAFREAATTTGNLEAVLPRLIIYRELDSADDPAMVLHHRVEAWAQRQTPDPSKSIPGTSIPRTTSTDPAINEALKAREEHLAAFAAAHPTPKPVAVDNGQSRGPESARHTAEDHHHEQEQPHWIREAEFIRDAAHQEHATDNPATIQTPDRPLHAPTQQIPDSAFPEEHELNTYRQDTAHHGY